MTFLRGLLDERANQVFSAKGYYYENAQQFAEHFQVFAGAIHKRQKISFIYNDLLRHVDPYRLIHHQGSWYLAAAVADELRAYRLSKIDQMVVHESELFDHHLEVLTQLELSEGIWFAKHKQTVKISVRPEVALYFKQRLLLPEQQIVLEDASGGLLIDCQICHEMQLLPLVRYWIPYIKIIEPAHFQEKLEQDLQHYLLPPLS